MTTTFHCSRCGKLKLKRDGSPHVCKAAPTSMPRKRHLTPEQIAAACARVRAGEPLAVVARDCGVDRTTISYHLRGGKAVRVLGCPWRAPLRAAYRHLGRGQRREAAAELRRAADLLDGLNAPVTRDGA